jgi:tetratricopeptide (TPR) repeat protein
MIFLAFTGKLSRDKELGIGLAHYSSQSAQFFKEQNLRGPIFNDYDIGSYLIFYLYPEVKPFIDNRRESYTDAFFSEIYLPMLVDEAKWQETLAKYNFNVIFFHHYDDTPHVRSFLSNRMRDPDWALVYADIYSVILLKNNSLNQDAIAKFQITESNIAEKLEYLLKSSNAQDQIAAADLFNLMGRFNLAMSTFLKVVDRWPNKGRVWMILGEMELSKNESSVNPVSAAQYLEKAILAGQPTAEAYAFLGWAYYRSGQFEKSAKALKEALQINPDRTDAKNLLSETQKYTN